MAGCTQGNFRLSMTITDTSGLSCNQGEPWKKHWPFPLLTCGCPGRRGAWAPGPWGIMGGKNKETGV